MHSEKCPICNGKGTIPQFNASTESSMEITCHGCNGKGWIEVRNEFGLDVFKPNAYDNNGDPIEYGYEKIGGKKYLVAM